MTVPLCCWRVKDEITSQVLVNHNKISRQMGYITDVFATLGGKGIVFTVEQKDGLMTIKTDKAEIKVDPSYGDIFDIKHNGVVESFDPIYSEEVESGLVLIDRIH